MATLNVRSKTSSTVTVYISGLDANYNNKTRTIYWTCGNATILPKSTTIANQITQTADIKLSGFSPSTTYTIYADIAYYDKDDDTAQSVRLSVTFTTASNASQRPSKFSWTLSKVTQGEDAVIYATDWNNLTKNINNVRAYKGLSSYTFTVAEKNNDFTAEIFNEAVSAIQGISGYGTSLNKVSKGDSFTAKKIDDLVSSINSVS